MHRASIAVRMTARGLIEAHRSIALTRDVLSQGPTMPNSLRRGMSLVSEIALRDGYTEDIGSQVNAFTVMASRPIREWGPSTFRECEERDAVLIDSGYGTPTEDCLQLAELGDESGIVEDIFHERLRSALATLGGTAAADSYRNVRENIIRRPCRRRLDVLEFAQSEPELAGEIPGFFRQLPASALDGNVLRLCAHCCSPLFPDVDRISYPHGRCGVRECRMMWQTPSVGSEHEVRNAADWRLADAAIMTYWVGPGLPEIALYDALRRHRSNVDLYPMSDMADVGIGGVDVGIDVKSYSSAAVLGRRFARDIGGLRAFRRRIVAVPDFWIQIDRDYLRTASAVSGRPDSIEFLSITDVITEFID